MRKLPVTDPLCKLSYTEPSTYDTGNLIYHSNFVAFFKFHTTYVVVHLFLEKYMFLIINSIVYEVYDSQKKKKILKLRTKKS